MLAILALFWCEFLALSAISRRDTSTWRGWPRLALAFPFVFAGLLVWMQPVTTTDLYGYVARGYLYVQLHLNPMTTPAFLLPGNLLVSRPPAPYGPAWLLLCGAFSLVAGNNLLLNMLLFKLLNLVCLAVCTWLLYALAQRLKIGAAAPVVMFFTWNPLVLFEAIGNGHNDIVMMMCVLGACLLMTYRRARLALALLVLGALIKYIAALLIPLWLVYELNQRRHQASRTPRVDVRDEPERQTAQRYSARMRRRASKARAAIPGQGAAAPSPGGVLATTSRSVLASGRAAVQALAEIERRAAVELIVGAAALSAVLVVAFYLPFWDGLKTFSGVGQQLRPLYYNGSLVQFIAAPLELLVPPADYSSLDKTIRLLFYVVFFVYAFIQTHRLWIAGARASLRDVITAGAKIFFAALILIAFWYQPWYVVWLLPLAALADKPFVRSQAAILSGGSLLTYAVGNYLFTHEPGIGQALFVQFFEVLVAFAPLLFLQMTPEERGWQGVIRSYVSLLGEGLRRRADIWDRVMLGLILVVAVTLRLTRLGNLFGTIAPNSPTSDALRQVSGDIRLILADPRGLEGPFALVERALVWLLGPTPFAVLLPSAVLGSLTVWLIYLVTAAVFTDEAPARARSLGLLAALLAATSAWHVSLSRSGVQVVTLPLLTCLSLYLLILALRVPQAVRPATTSTIRRHVRRGRFAATCAVPDHAERKRVVLFAASGACAGLASDLAAGLWVLPVLAVAALVFVRWRRPGWYVKSRTGLTVLASAAVLAGLPGAWQYYLSRYVGFAPGHGALAKSTQGALSFHLRDVLGYFAQVGRNIGSVAHVLIAQDYSAGGPGAGGAPIIPAIITPFFFVGIVLIVWRWRRFSSIVVLLLLALPFIASVSGGPQASVIEAASALPAICIIPALALYELALWFGRLPIALDRAHGVRVFATPERIGRLLLMVFLLISAMRTFYWYFQATLPVTPPNTIIAT